MSVLLYALLLAWLARALNADRITSESALLILSLGSVAAGAAYLVGLRRIVHGGPAVPTAWVVAMAVASRLVVGTSPALLENDYYRYLWDGGVVAAGINPYVYSPIDVANGEVAGPDQGAMRLLAAESGNVLERINNPHLTTVYPPLAQVAFAIAHVIDPFGITGWRVVLCLADAVTMLLLVRLLRALELPSAQIVWYAWNPILLREVYSSLHMDMLALPVLVGAVLAGVRLRNTLGAALCVIGSAVKVWPIVLAPLLLRPLFGRWKSLATAVALCAPILAMLWLPVFAVRQGDNSGFIAYGRGWQNNDGFFRAGIWLTERVLEVIHVEPWHSHMIMRAVFAVLVLGTVLWQIGISAPQPRDLPRRCLFVTGAIFLLSPTQFPWYWLWCLPLLTVQPSLPLLLYTALLPLYYLQDRTQAVYWLEHVPVWGLLAMAVIRPPRPRGARDRVGGEVAPA